MRAVALFDDNGAKVLEEGAFQLFQVFVGL
jgi:hypothetical protein